MYYEITRDEMMANAEVKYIWSEDVVILFIEVQKNKHLAVCFIYLFWFESGFEGGKERSVEMSIEYSLLLLYCL